MRSRTRNALENIGRIPVVTLTVTAVIWLIAPYPAWHEALAFDRQALAQGQALRLFTGHLVHWNMDHLVWDALMFTVLGALLEMRSRAALWATMGWSALAISAGVWCLQPEVMTYRGLSGVDTALFTAIATMTWCEARREGQTKVAGVAGAALVALIAKIAYEQITGTTLFVDSSEARFVPLPLAHLIGGLVGVLVAWRMHSRQCTVPSRAKREKEVGGTGLEPVTSTV